MLKIGVFVEFLRFFDDFRHFLKKISNFFSTHFIGIFELQWQSSQFWLRWNNFIFSKWLSYSRFTKSILPSLQVENVTAYHPSTICVSRHFYITQKGLILLSMRYFVIEYLLFEWLKVQTNWFGWLKPWN